MVNTFVTYVKKNRECEHFSCKQHDFFETKERALPTDIMGAGQGIEIILADIGINLDQKLGQPSHVRNVHMERKLFFDYM